MPYSKNSDICLMEAFYIAETNNSIAIYGLDIIDISISQEEIGQMMGGN